MLNKKICSNCSIEKPLDQFYQCHSGPRKGQVDSWCKDCRKKQRNTPEAKQRKKEYSKQYHKTYKPSPETIAKHNAMTEKKCPRCHRILSIDNFNRYKSGNLKGKYFSWCNDCESEYQKQARKNPNKIAKRQKRYDNITEKECSKCGRTLSKSEFKTDRGSSDMLTHWCNDCWNEWVRERWHNNQDYRNRMKKAWYEHKGKGFIPLFRNPFPFESDDHHFHGPFTIPMWRRAHRKCNHPDIQEHLKRCDVWIKKLYGDSMMEFIELIRN